MNETREMTEEELVALAKARDGAAWTELYNRHFGQLYRYAYARLGSREQAEDIASQVFLSALKSINQFDYRGKPILAWLYRIASNLVLQEVRSGRRGESWQMNGVSQIPALVTEDPTEGYFLRDAISRLTRDQREVIVLRFLLSHSLKEVAVMLGKTEMAVASLQFRGVGALRRMITRTEGFAILEGSAA